MSGVKFLANFVALFFRVFFFTPVSLIYKNQKDGLNKEKDLQAGNATPPPSPEASQASTKTTKLKGKSYQAKKLRINNSLEDLKVN